MAAAAKPDGSGLMRSLAWQGNEDVQVTEIVAYGAGGPIPPMETFDRGVQLRMGWVHVQRGISDLIPMVSDDRGSPGGGQFATHHRPRRTAARGCEIFRGKADGCIKVVLQP